MRVLHFICRANDQDRLEVKLGVDASENMVDLISVRTGAREYTRLDRSQAAKLAEELTAFAAEAPRALSVPWVVVSEH